MNVCGRSSRSTVRSVLLLLLVAPLGGCVAVVAGAAAYAAIEYESNEVSQTYRASLGDTWQASIAELREMGYPVQEGTKPGPTEGTVEISDVAVRVEKLSAEHTRVGVRFGTFDTEEHRRKAILLLDVIANRIS